MQVLENTEGGATGSLVACLDMCTTVMGKRQLRAWLCRPMARIDDITARQDAVAELMGPAADAAQAARTALTGKPSTLHSHVLKGHTVVQAAINCPDWTRSVPRQVPVARMQHSPNDVMHYGPLQQMQHY
jgi:hypothetical protein